MWPFSKKQQLIEIPAAYGFELKSLTLPQAMPRWNMFASKGPWDVQKAITEGYNESTIVYACVEKRAKLIASVPWVVKVKGKDDEGNDTWVKDDSHPLNKLVSRPNPDQSFYELMYNSSQYLDLAGSAFLSKIRAGLRDEPQELWCLPSQYMKIAPGKVRLVDYYEYSLQTGRSGKIESKDMVHLRLPNPDSPYFGMPVLKAAAKPTDIDRESAVFQKVSFENRGAADINIKLAPDATQEQVERVKDQYKKQQTGAKNARKALITNADIQNIGSNNLEMDFVNSRRAAWTEICAAFGMSLANLGMTEAVNLANAEAMNKALWENTIIPQLELIKRQLTHQLAGDYGDDVRLEPDLSNVEALQDKLIDKLESAAKAQALGVPFNEYNEKLELGFKAREDGDVSYIPQGLIPASYDLGLDDGSNAEDDGSEAYG